MLNIFYGLTLDTAWGILKKSLENDPYKIKKITKTNLWLKCSQYFHLEKKRVNYKKNVKFIKGKYYTCLAKVHEIKGARRLETIIWSFLLILGGIGFFSVGLSSFLKKDIFFITYGNVNYLPQGITLTFYGSLGLILGIYLALTVIWNIGSGTNEFISRRIKKGGSLIIIRRKGFPSKRRLNNEIFSVHPIGSIDSLKMVVRDQSLNPQRQINLCLKNKKEIPLLSITSPEKLMLVESDTLHIAKWLRIKAKMYAP